ncbi:MAG: hypothetical protein P8181_03880 [bacterium]
MSWSGTQKYIEDRGENPTDIIAAELESVWGDADTTHRVRWPLFVRAARII